MEVELAIHQNANKMSKRFEKKKRVKIGHFYENQTVSVSVPKIDRPKTDMPRIPAVILRKIGDKAPT